MLSFLSDINCTTSWSLFHKGLNLNSEERKAIKKAKKVANRKKARQEAKKFNHFSTSSTTSTKTLSSSTTTTTTTTTTSAPATASRFDPEAPIRIPSQLSNPLARQNRMNPALLPPRPSQTSTTDYATTPERESTTEEMSTFNDRYGKLFLHPLFDSNFLEKHLLNKEKRIRQRLHEQLLEKKKKFNIQSRSLSKFQQDSFGFEDYETQGDQIMFLESETLENFIGKLNMR